MVSSQSLFSQIVTAIAEVEKENKTTGRRQSIKDIRAASKSSAAAAAASE